MFILTSQLKRLFQPRIIRHKIEQARDRARAHNEDPLVMYRYSSQTSSIVAIPLETKKHV